MALAITPSVTEYRYGDPDAANPVVTATGATGTVHWSVSAGAVSPSTGASTTLSPLNRTERVTITAEDDIATVTTIIQIWATFPVQPKWMIESDMGIPITRWPMVYEKRTQDEYFQVMAFWAWHKQALLETSEAEDGTVVIRVLRGLPFYLYDIPLQDLAKVYFDSPIRRASDSGGFFYYSFQLVCFESIAPVVEAPAGAVRLLEGGGFRFLES